MDLKFKVCLVCGARFADVSFDAESRQALEDALVAHADRHTPVEYMRTINLWWQRAIDAGWREPASDVLIEGVTDQVEPHV
jgi:hypothetical protein